MNKFGMAEKASRMQTGWDAREEFVRELMYRAHEFLSGDAKTPLAWFETLRDFYSISCPFLTLDDRKMVRAQIIKIKRKLYGLRVNGNKLTVRDKAINIEQAYEEIRDLFEYIHLQVFKSGIYLPVYKKQDPNKAIMNMGI